MKTLATAIPLLMLMLMCVCTHATADTFGTGANQFEIEFVEIGDPGNVPDTTGCGSEGFAACNAPNPNPAGSVDYIYRIGKFEVSRDMVEKANAEGGLGITLTSQSFIQRPEMPATSVDWYEAARFVNWLNTSQGFTAAYKFSAQPGDIDYDANADNELWEEGDAGFDAANLFRNSQARYFLPSVHEWYKAAYYDPATGDYWDYPTGSNTPPIPVAGGTDPNTAVYGQEFEQGPADITQAGGLSAFGVMGLGGNAFEWEETTADLRNDAVTRFSVRGVRSGDWPNILGALYPSFRTSGPPDFATSVVGFRVASVAELLGDCNGDSVLNAADLSCVSSVEARDVVLDALNTLPGDLDGNGEVAFADFLELANNFGTDLTSYADGNIDLNNGVEFADFLELANNFGRTTSNMAAAPEPSSLIVAWLNLLGFVASRRTRRR